MKLALGTVQFGLDYGVANTEGQVTKEVAKQILQYAKEFGVSAIDTAIDYGESESCLGGIGVEEWKIVTKIPQVKVDCIDIADWINAQFMESLDRLRLNNVHGLMLHQPVQLAGSYGKHIWNAMNELKDRKLVNKIGYSIYDPSELELLWDTFQPDIIQAPYNVFDHRLKESGWLERLYEEGVEIHVRSVFLQGLLLMDSIFRPSKFDQWKEVWDVWGKWLYDNEITSIEACLNFVEAEKMIDHIVIGVDSLSQLKEILNIKNKNDFVIPEELKITDQNLINPSNWNKL